MYQEKSAGLIIFRIDHNNPLFLLLHYGWGHWGFPKGNIEDRETQKEAAIREAAEETGLVDLNLYADFYEKIEYFYRRAGNNVHKEVVYFLAQTNESEIKLSFEHRGFKWLTFNEALDQLTYNNDKRVLIKANRRIKT